MAWIVGAGVFLLVVVDLVVVVVVVRCAILISDDSDRFVGAKDATISFRDTQANAANSCDGVDHFIVAVTVCVLFVAGIRYPIIV